jgi:quercetin dioxygenase-like cupin family protein
VNVELVPKQPSVKGPPELFTGDVYLDIIAWGEEPSRVRVNAVHFAPGARTAWHSHALGQTLYVTEGVGRVQSRDEPIVEIRPGDIVHAHADEVHWHGAAPDHFMAHLSVTEGVGDSEQPETDWGDHVTEAEYRAQG